MNIALFTDAYLPSKTGVVTVVNQLYEGLKSQGHHVIIITVDNPEVTDASDNPDVYRVPSSKMGWGMKDQYFGFPFLKKVSKIIKQNKIDIIHCHTEFSMGFNAIHESRKCHLPLVATTHTMWEDYYKFYLPGADHISPERIRSVVKKFYSHMGGLINVSGKAHDYFKQDDICPEIPSAIIPNSINPKNYCANPSTPEEIAGLRKELGINEDEKMILFVGRVVEEKRVFELVDILDSVFARSDKSKAVIVGDGAALKYMMKLVSLSPYHDRFMFTGFIDNSLVHKYYEAADLFVSPSLSEMHSMTVLEALTSGLPIVVRKDTSYNDTVIDDFNGYQTDTDEQMADVISDIIGDEALLEKFGNNSRTRSVEFLPETFINRHIAYYQTVIDAWKSHKKLTDEMLTDAVVSASEK